MDTKKQLSLDEELLILLANQAQVSPFNMLAAMGIIAYLIYPHVPDQPWLLAAWLLLVAVSQIYRRHRLLQLPEQRERPVAERTREAARIQQLCSGIMALCFLAFPILTPFEAAMMTMFFIAMGVGSIVAALGWPPYTKAHIWGHLIPLFILWGWSGYAGPAGVVAYLCALIGTAYSASMWKFSKRLFQMNEEFFDNRTALAKALSDAEVANSAKSRFLAAASHDLRQPVHTLSLLSATLKRRPLDDRTLAISNTMETAVNALSTELDSLLDISKLDAGMVAINGTDFDLHSLLSYVTIETQERASQRGITFRLECPRDTVCHTDQVLLERIVRNLIENALVHNRDCDIVATVKSLEDSLLLSIEDTGSGIAEDEQQRVFEEFYQVMNPERDRASGLGLGLSIVQRLSVLLDLRMEFASQVGEGTRFSFHLPKGDSLNQPAALPGKEFDLNGISLLIVDDELTVRLAMQELLVSLGCEVKCVGGMQDAINSVGNSVPDMALVDLRLSGNSNGIETVAALRAIQPDLRAIIISGDTSPERLQAVQDAGLPLLHKPTTESALCDAIVQNLPTTVDV